MISAQNLCTHIFEERLQKVEKGQRDDGATISQTEPVRLAECTTLATDRKSCRKLMSCRSAVSDLLR